MLKSIVEFLKDLSYQQVTFWGVISGFHIVLNVFFYQMQIERGVNPPTIFLIIALANLALLGLLYVTAKQTRRTIKNMLEQPITQTQKTIERAYLGLYVFIGAMSLYFIVLIFWAIKTGDLK